MYAKLDRLMIQDIGAFIHEKQKKKNVRRDECYFLLVSTATETTLPDAYFSAFYTRALHVSEFRLHTHILARRKRRAGNNVIAAELHA